jgi:hypothetical protein
MSSLHQDHDRDVDCLGSLFHGGCIGTTCKNVQGGPTPRRDQVGAPSAVPRQPRPAQPVDAALTSVG